MSEGTFSDVVAKIFIVIQRPFQPRCFSRLTNWNPKNPVPGSRRLRYNLKQSLATKTVAFET